MLARIIVCSDQLICNVLLPEELGAAVGFAGVVDIVVGVVVVDVVVDVVVVLMETVTIDVVSVWSLYLYLKLTPVMFSASPRSVKQYLCRSTPVRFLPDVVLTKLVLL